MASSYYGRISRIEEGSPASSAGLRVGDELISVGSEPVRDILDYNYLAADERAELHVLRDGQPLVFAIDKGIHEDLGIDFETDLFDGVRVCRNDCIFCFLRQMPAGMRKSLYVRDDDYRLSLAHGNYVTLTNLSREDMDRICSQRMSPIYVSVHSTDPELRANMLGNPRAGDIMGVLHRLAECRIAVHAQIVLCPGINDGERLERTVRDLASLHPSVASVVVVPVGVTKHREGLPRLAKVDAELARRTLDEIGRWQREFREKFCTRLVFASDEFYLLAGRPFPRSAAYEGFPQLEDGVGISRLFLDDLRRMARRGGAAVPPGKYVLVTGILAAPLLQRLADVLGKLGAQARVCTIGNKFLGETVTVAGLLTGADVSAGLEGAYPDEIALIPEIMLNQGRFLDDVTLSDLQKLVKCSVLAVPPTPSGVVRVLSAHAVSCTAGGGTECRE